MSLAEKEIYAVELEMKIEKRIAAVAYFNECVLIEIAATLALYQFQKKYTRAMINRNPPLQEEELHTEQFYLGHIIPQLWTPGHY